MQAAINAGGSLLPTDLPAPPVYAKVNPADAPVLTLAVTSDTHAAHRRAESRRDAARAEDLARSSGVGLVTLVGRPAARGADPGRHARAGVVSASASISCAPRSPAANANGAKGSFDGPTRSYAINANDQLVTVDDYRNLIVAYRNGAPVRLSDVADVVDSAENVKLGAWAEHDSRRSS